MARRRSLIARFLLSRRLWLVAGILIALFVLLNYFLLPLYVKGGGTMTVPVSTGRTFDDARRMLDSLGLQAVEAGSRPDPKVAAGLVVLQNPPGGAVVKVGRRVYLTLSGGEVLVAVPRLRGLSARDSRFTLERSGLLLGTMDYDTSNVFPENTIISQSLPPGSRVARGTGIGVVVSRGRTAQEVLVPELTGRTLTEAQKILAEKGLGVGTLTYQPSFELLPNTVVDQYPRGGSMLAAGGSVDLFIVRAGKPKEEIQRPE